jgi:hypothetical protein
MIDQMLQDIQDSGVRIGVCAAVACLGTLLMVYEPKATFLGALAILLCGAILWQPFIGIPVIILLGIAGELQHFESGFSIQKAVIGLITLGLIGRTLVQDIRFRRTGLVVPLITFFLIFCLLQSRDIGDDEDRATTLTYLGYPLGFFLVLNLVKSRRQVWWASSAIILGAITASLATFLQYFGDYSVLYAIRGIEPVATSQVADGWQRAIGLMQSPNVQAYPYLLAIPLLFALLFSGLRQWIKIALFSGLMTCFFGLAITFSRSGYIGVLVGLAWLGFMLPARKSWRLAALASVLVCMTFLIVPPTVLIERFLTIPEQIGGQSDRSIHYEAAWESTIENPVVGGGSNAFGSALTRREGGERDIPHSNLLIVLVDSGLVGLAAMVWFLIRYIRFIRHGLTVMPWSPMKYCLMGICAGLISFMAQGLFVPNMGWSILWVIAALPACCKFARENADLAGAEVMGRQALSGAQ